jgi:hypothetical protein
LVARAREKEKEGEFCRRAKAVPSPVVAYREPQHGRGAAATCGGAVRECASAAWHRPRPPRSVTTI